MLNITNKEAYASNRFLCYHTKDKGMSGCPDEHYNMHREFEDLLRKMDHRNLLSWLQNADWARPIPSSWEKAIERFLLIMMLVYAFCAGISADDSGTLGDSHKLARDKIKRDLIAWVHDQACHRISLSKIKEEQDLAS